MVAQHKNQANLAMYRNTEVNTANRLKLLIMLYEGTLRFGQRAEEALAAGNLAEKGVMISKMLAIVSELRSTLDHGKAPEVAGNLDRLYEFIHEKLVQANIRNDVQLLRDAMRVLRILHSAWVEVSRKPQAELAVKQPDSQAEAVKKASTGAQADNYVHLSV